MSEQPRPEPTVDLPASDPALDAGMAAAFGPDSGPPIPAGASVLQALGAAVPEMPRVVLREPQTEAEAPASRPQPSELPPGQAPAGRYELHGEIARGGMGAVLK